MIDKKKIFQRALYEAFESRRFAPGQVNFKKSSFNDPHIAKVLAFISKSLNKPVSVIINDIQNKAAEFKPMRDKAPILYETIHDNIIESTLFNMFWKEIPNRHVPGAPRFSKVVFNNLIRYIKAEHDQFFPLRSFIDPKHLYSPVIHFTQDETATKKTPFDNVDTACATPSGQFVFSVPFCQALIDWAHLVGLRPKGRKYKSNGGPIPDEYGYIEFVIMHEFMHYTYDDFHYQKIIPNADPNIINWVGDFRTNYLLVKSGYEQLPMGLFNDHINYDRQKKYIDMYNIVKEEFEKLKKDDQDKIKRQMNDSSDDHEPGQEEGRQSDAGQGESPDKIDEKNDKVEKAMKDGEDKGSDEVKRDDSKDQSRTSRDGTGARGTGNDKWGEIDYSKVFPKYSWTAIIKQFIAAESQHREESYQKPSRRAMSGIHAAAQVGAGAMKPGEIPVEQREAKLGIVVDSSGSMSHVIEKAYSNIYNLFVKTPGLQNAEFTLIKFSASHKIYKGVFKRQMAGAVTKITDRPVLNLNLKNVFNEHSGGVTNFTNALVNDLLALMQQKYNILLFSDSDICSGENFNELMRLFKSPSGKLFIIFDSRDTYINFRQEAKMTTPNISYFAE
jgi:hypothetical protein